jgi:hypothetical protein
VTSTGILTVARGTYGLMLLLAPGSLVSLAAGAPPSNSACRVARILGARHVAQALISGWAETTAWAAGSTLSGRRVISAGAAVDGIHAASMLILAWANPQLRRAELGDAAVAAVLAGLGGGSGVRLSEEGRS